jgi:hypothetical protein
MRAPFRSSVALVLLVSAAAADLYPEWIATLPVGTTLAAGTQGFVVDAAGVSYVTANSGDSNNNDITTAAYAPDGTLLWSQVFDGVIHWHDQARDIALGPDGTIWVCGNTPAASKHADVLLLQYDAATGALLKFVQYTTGFGLSEHAQALAVDGLGNVYTVGGTVGDGSDALVNKFDPAGNVVWTRTWDGPAWGPYSQDHGQDLRLAPDGDPIVMIDGVMSSLHADYVLARYSRVDGSLVWETTWGQNGDDFPNAMQMDAAGDVYATGTALNLGNDQYGTIKVRGTDGQLLWEAYDSAGIDDHGRALGLDGFGGVVLTGSVDPDGDHSNFNDNIYTVRRDAATGAPLWSHLYGADCIGCLDLPSDVVVDSAGNVFVAGITSSPPYSADQITLVLDVATGIEVERAILDGQSGFSAGSGALRFDAAENLFNGGTTGNATTGAKEVSVVRFTSLAQTFFNLQATVFASGSVATVFTADGTPSAAQWVVFSGTGTGSLPLAPLGVTLSLANPLLLFAALADGSGGVSASPIVPAGLGGLTVWLQAVGFGEATPVVKRTIL